MYPSVCGGNLILIAQDQQALLLNHKRKKENKRIFTKAEKT